MNPLRTTSVALIRLGIDSTFSASSSASSPSSSSAITGKKFSSSPMFRLRASLSPRPAAVSEQRSFANCS